MCRSYSVLLLPLSKENRTIPYTSKKNEDIFECYTYKMRRLECTIIRVCCRPIPYLNEDDAVWPSTEMCKTETVRRRSIKFHLIPSSFLVSRFRRPSATAVWIGQACRIHERKERPIQFRDWHSIRKKINMKGAMVHTHTYINIYIG
jgi:hypothetical protein